MKIGSKVSYKSSDVIINYLCGNTIICGIEEEEKGIPGSKYLLQRTSSL